jgi:hypothetical protein
VLAAGSSGGTMCHVCGILAYTLKKESVFSPERLLHINKNKQLYILSY